MAFESKFEKLMNHFGYTKSPGIPEGDMVFRNGMHVHTVNTEDKTYRSQLSSFSRVDEVGGESLAVGYIFLAMRDSPKVKCLISDEEMFTEETMKKYNVEENLELMPRADNVAYGWMDLPVDSTWVSDVDVMMAIIGKDEDGTPYITVEDHESTEQRYKMIVWADGDMFAKLFTSSSMMNVERIHKVIFG